MTQPQLIEQVLTDLRLHRDNTARKQTPAQSSEILRQPNDSEEFDRHFDYISMVGKCLYLEKCTRPEIAYAVHQCAWFASAPSKEYAKILK